MINRRGWAVVLIWAAALVLLASQARAESGLASFYGGKRHHGKPMANGQIYDQNSDSCAHKTLPFGTVLKVTTRAGRSVRCVVRDRGPYRPGRIVDVSVGAAKALNMVGAGVVPVTVERVR